AIADSFGVKMAHHEEAQVASHLMGAIAHGSYVECFHHNRDPIFWEIQTEPRPIKDGYYTISDDPGFGIHLDQDYIKRFQVD
ncbi:MAG: mandelate racemase/muconate lactonizing enzyme family protein, partial [Anaerolineae bacterium]|nr:mandelate racemase/muconate lactonizing enzyme family protein [Anaerolineae bacterium]